MQKIVKIMRVIFYVLCVVGEWGLYYKSMVPHTHAGTEWRDWVGVKMPVSNSIIGTQNCRLQCVYDSINADSQYFAHVDVSMGGKMCDECTGKRKAERLKDGKNACIFADVLAVGLHSHRTTITTPSPSPNSSPAWKSKSISFTFLPPCRWHRLGSDALPCLPVIYSTYMQSVIFTPVRLLSWSDIRRIVSRLGRSLLFATHVFGYMIGDYSHGMTRTTIPSPI